MSEGGVGQWCIILKNHRNNVYNEEWSGRLSIVTDELVAKINGKLYENQCCTVTRVSLQFPQISWSFLNEVVTLKDTISFVPGGHQKSYQKIAKQTVCGSIVDISQSLQQRWWLTSRSCCNWRWDLGKTSELWDKKTSLYSEEKFYQKIKEMFANGVIKKDHGDRFFETGRECFW